MGLSRIPSFSNRPGFPAGLRILLIDPDSHDSKTVGAQLRECNYQVCECADESEASRQISKVEEEFDLLICEASVVAHQSTVWSAFMRNVKHLPLVLTGENISQQQKLLGIKFGAVDFLEKPVALLKLRNIWQHTVRKMMKQKSPASQTEADTSSGPKPTSACRSGPVSSAADKPAIDSAQESTGSSQADPAQPESNTGKPKNCDRKTRSSSDLRAVRRSSSYLSGKASTEKAATVAIEATPTTVTQASGAAATRTPEVGMPASASVGARGASAAPSPAVAALQIAAPQMAPQSMYSYSPQGMPAPLPGCVWGLPMLPPPVPGFMPPMMVPQQPPMMMPAQNMYGGMPWGQQMHGGMPYGAPQMMPCAAAAAAAPNAAGVPAPATASACMPAKSAPCASASGSDIVMSSPGHGSGGSGAGKDGSGGSMATWSRDASTATNLQKLEWGTEVAADDVDVFGLAAGADDLHEFSDSLLQADADGCEGGGKATVGRQAEAEGLSWMQEEYLMDEFKPVDERGPFLDVVA